MTSLCLFILVTLFAPSSYSQEDDGFYNECSKPFDCGRVRNLSYPFWRDGRSPCGLGGFSLQCKDGEDPVITIDNHDFSVVSLNQSANEMAIVRRYGLKPDLCPDETNPTTNFTNITLDASRFCLVPDFYTKFSNISLFYNCTDLQTTNSSMQRFHCNVDGEERGAFYGYDGLQGGWMDDISKCTIKLEIPVPKTALQGRQLGRDDLIGVSEQGFNVSYLYNQDTCNSCRASGGICGTNTTNLRFTCFCSDHPDPVSCSNKPGSPRNVKLKVFIAAMTLVGTLFTCCSIYLCMRIWQLTPGFLRKNQNFEAFLESHGPLALKRYNYSQVKKMTNSFEEKLGQGGYGKVYKGKLLDGRLVAVKMLNVSKEKLGKDFINEVAAISRTSHVNIVTLLGFCLEGGKKRALIYEFLPNGSLDKFIRHTPDNDEHLGWEIIDQIAIGIAQGLEYLHKGCNTRIVHLDIKPQNVLLDKKLTPKISDFGLAKLYTRTESRVSMSEARGTVGYMAPEVYNRNFEQVSSKSDVYSYGMMILKIVEMRKKDEQVEGSNFSEMGFPSWIYKSLESENGNDAIGEEDREGEIVRKLKLVGFWCIQTNPSNRPTMSTVIEWLRGSTQNLSIPPMPSLFPSTSYSSTKYFDIEQKSQEDIM